MQDLRITSAPTTSVAGRILEGRPLTDQEGNRILGQSGTEIFEKHYQGESVKRDLQHLGLLRPAQEGLLRRAACMLRNRDHLAPSS
ncbi:hypothetical protein Egran_00121 [Elaphomyces granulatus]|uniref:Uncharacterized protein n=1 Tax=Elaphomyces granulatus TaxID=519963 RepID=A0A232M6U6_9EURO|nr:hypothetical protein Egran_00121 [Elaphomyces granulatus]